MSDSGATTNQWGEDASQTFLDWAQIFVPARDEQIATLLDLLPTGRDEDFTVVELASGEGRLAGAILERFPRCRYLALDGSAAMREQTRRSLARFAERLDVQPFDLFDMAWRGSLPVGTRCVLSSLSIHHLDDAGKRRLFRDMYLALAPGGALLIADLVLPTNERIAQLYARQYDEIVQAQSLALRGDLSGYEAFRQEQWNYFAYDYYDYGPEAFDKPSRLSDQLRWLEESGFTMVDCFWLRAGHAIYGGYKKL